MNNSVTYLKAFGIILVVLGHTMNSLMYFNQFIFMFHMPLFFFVSGFCFKRDYIDHPKTYLWKRVKSIYWPYVKWSLVFLLLHNLFFRLDIYNSQYGWLNVGSYVYDTHELLRRARNIVLIMCDHEQLLGGYWFLNALFYGSVIAFLSLKLLRKVWKALAFNMGVTFVLTYMDIAFPYRTYMILQACYTSTFVLAGMLFAERRVPVFPGWAIVLSLVLTFVGSVYWPTSVGAFPYIPKFIVPFFLTAVLATWSFYSIFTWIDEQSVMTRFLSFVGRNTMTILTWHMLAFKLVSLLIIYVEGLDFKRLAEFPVIYTYSFGGWWYLYFIVALLVTCGIAYLNRYIKKPWLKL